MLLRVNRGVWTTGNSKVFKQHDLESLSSQIQKLGTKATNWSSNPQLYEMKSCHEKLS